MWHSPGNALWQQPGSPCEVTPRLWHEECPAASSPFLRDCSSQVAPGPSLRLHIREDANTVAAARLYRAARACPLLYRPPRLRTSSALRLFERSPTCPDGRLLARHRVGRRPARRWPPVPSLPSHRAPPLHASPGGLPHHRRRLARSWPPTPALLLFWALPLAPSTPDLECPAPSERPPTHPDAFTVAVGSAAALLAADRPRLPRRYARHPRLRTLSAHLVEDAPRASRLRTSCCHTGACSPTPRGHHTT